MSTKRNFITEDVNEAFNNAIEANGKLIKMYGRIKDMEGSEDMMQAIKKDTEFLKTRKHDIKVGRLSITPPAMQFMKVATHKNQLRFNVINTSFKIALSDNTYNKDGSTENKFSYFLNVKEGREILEGYENLRNADDEVIEQMDLYKEREMLKAFEKMIVASENIIGKDIDDGNLFVTVSNDGKVNFPTNN